MPLYWRMVPGSLLDTRQTLSSGPGPDASKQLAARDGYLSAVSQLSQYLHKPVDVAFLFFWERRLRLWLLYFSTSKVVGDLCPPCSL